MNMITWLYNQVINVAFLVYRHLQGHLQSQIVLKFTFYFQIFHNQLIIITRKINEWNLRTAIQPAVLGPWIKQYIFFLRQNQNKFWLFETMRECSHWFRASKPIGQSTVGHALMHHIPYMPSSWYLHALHMPSSISISWPGHIPILTACISSSCSFSSFYLHVYHIAFIILILFAIACHALLVLCILCMTYASPHILLWPPDFSFYIHSIIHILSLCLCKLSLVCPILLLTPGPIMKDLFLVRHSDS